MLAHKLTVQLPQPLAFFRLPSVSSYPACTVHPLCDIYAGRRRRQHAGRCWPGCSAPFHLASIGPVAEALSAAVAASPTAQHRLLLALTL